MSSEPAGARAGGGDPAGELNEEELRAAYEAELNRITSAEVMLQAAVSLLNIGGRRLGLASGADPGATPVKDLAQVRDAIDGVRALLGVLERGGAHELGPLRDALAQLQLAYAREAQAGASEEGAAQAAAARQGAADEAAAAQPAGSDAGVGGQQGGVGGEQGRRAGPAEASGRLWVPDR